MKNLEKHIDLLMARYPELEGLRNEIRAAYDLLEKCYENGGKVLIAGNGGSCADAQHIVGELMKGFKLRRKMSEEFCKKLKAIDPVRGEKLAEDLQDGLPAIALDSHSALNTAFMNDVDGLEMYAQQLNVLGTEKDVLIGISTSGNSKNVMYAAVVAKAKGMKVLGLTGGTGGQIAEIADVALIMPTTETYMIQELHLPVYHCLCLMLEERFFGE